MVRYIPLGSIIDHFEQVVLVTLQSATNYKATKFNEAQILADREYRQSHYMLHVRTNQSKGSVTSKIVWNNGRNTCGCANKFFVKNVYTVGTRWDCLDTFGNCVMQITSHYRSRFIQ